MTERDLSLSSSSPELVVPENTLFKPEKKKITAGQLYGIFGMDIKLITQSKLRNFGIVAELGELEFSDDPLIHSYEDENGNKFESDGQYFIEAVVGQHGVLASFLPPRSITSEHMHKHPIQEKYMQIAGHSIVNIGGIEKDLFAGMEATVPIDTEHQVHTERLPAFTLIIMGNAGLVPRKDWHIQTSRFGRKKH